ncbi:unnamed protein product [Lactuca virosa]|uniref:Uncharacterized protein n=1 Tax=Lactuca virosa TaxID=75947 RepID=A0AAU9MAH3_9ASTR|nr:unnamed protein product [Lactuca virosa]
MWHRVYEPVHRKEMEAITFLRFRLSFRCISYFKVDEDPLLASCGITIDFYAMYLVQNGLIDLSSTTIPCSELASHGANEHSETHNGSLAFLLLRYSEALTSRTFCSSDSSVTDKQTFNFGYEKMESVFHPDVFPAHPAWKKINKEEESQSEVTWRRWLQVSEIERVNKLIGFG